MARDGSSDRRVTVPTANSDRFTERVREVVGEESVRNFAKRAGVGLSTLQHVIEGGKPGVDKLVAIARAGGVTVDWLATGEGPKRRHEEGPGLAEPPTPFKDATTSLVDDHFVLVPRYDVQASAGPGAFADMERVTDVLAFRADWVRRTLRTDPAQLALISAAGDSMDPTIRPGDLLLVDTSANEVAHDGIYVVVMGTHVLVKRVQRLYREGLVVKSDNPAYDEIRIGPDEMGEFIVAGRVCWVGRTI